MKSTATPDAANAVIRGDFTQLDLHRAGAALLRIALGIMFIAHSVVLKYFTFTLGGTAQYFASIGLPSSLAYVVFALETVGGVLLVLGIRTRWVALGLVPVLIGATWAHLGNGWVFNAPNGGWEYPLFLIVISLVVALQAGKSGKWGHSSFPRTRSGIAQKAGK